MFVSTFKHIRIFKANRLRRGVKLDTPELRDSYRIARKHEKDFANAFKQLVRDLLPESMPKEFREAWNEKSVAKIVDALVNEKDVERFSDRLVDAYAKVIQESGDDATDRLNKQFKTDLQFTIAKQTIPVNPYSRDWIKERSLELVKEGITKPQREVVTEILTRSFERGGRAENTYKLIRSNIGLTTRENKAVLKRRDLHEDSGLSADRVDLLTDKYRNQLLNVRAERIARTETIAAQAQGRIAVWKIAQESGALPEVERLWMSAPPSANPNRPCDDCLDMDGRTTTLNEPYQGAFGEVMSPPLHPGCECAESLTRKGEYPKKPLEFVPRERPAARVLTHRPVVAKKPAKLPEKRIEVSQPRTGMVVRLDPVQQSVDQTARYLSKSEGRFEKASQKDRRSFLQWNWVHGSNRKMSVRMKEAAKREFGLKGQVRNPRKFRITDRQVNGVRGDLRSLYNDTQKELKARGAKTIRLYRGVKTDTITPGVLESWTTDLETARKFGSKVMVEDMPINKILNFRGSRSWTDGIWGNQSEFMVMS